MNFNPPPSDAQKASTSSKTSSSGLRLVKGQPSAWGQAAPGSSTRRGLTPISTTTDPSSDLNRKTNASSPSHFSSAFPPIPNSLPSQDATRGHSSSASAFPPLQTGFQQISQAHSILSPRSRTITPSSNTQSAPSAATSTTASQVGGGGGSGGGGALNRSQTFSPPLSHNSIVSPTSGTFDRSNYSGSASSSATAGQSTVTRIVDTQIFLLLGSISEKEGKAKWESQAEQIRNVSILSTSTVNL